MSEIAGDAAIELLEGIRAACTTMMDNGQLPTLYDKEAFTMATLEEIAGIQLLPSARNLVNKYLDTLQNPPGSTAESREQALKVITSGIDFLALTEIRRWSTFGPPAAIFTSSLTGAESENDLRAKVEKLEKQALLDAEALVQAQVKYVDYVTVCEENENLMKMISDQFAKFNRSEALPSSSWVSADTSGGGGGGGPSPSSTISSIVTRTQESLKIRELELELQKVHQSLLHANTSVTKMQEEVSNSQSAKEAAEHHIGDLLTDLELAHASKKAADAHAVQLSDQIASACSTRESLEAKLAELEAELRKLDKAEAAMVSALQAKAYSDNRANKVQQELDEAGRANDSLQQQLKDLDDSIRKLKIEKDILAQECSEQQVDLEAVRQSLIESQGFGHNLENQIAELQAQIQLKEEQIARMMDEDSALRLVITEKQFENEGLTSDKEKLHDEIRTIMVMLQSAQMELAQSSGNIDAENEESSQAASDQLKNTPQRTLGSAVTALASLSPSVRNFGASLAKFGAQKEGLAATTRGTAPSTNSEGSEKEKLGIAGGNSKSHSLIHEGGDASNTDDSLFNAAIAESSSNTAANKEKYRKLELALAALGKEKNKADNQIKALKDELKAVKSRSAEDLAAARAEVEETEASRVIAQQQADSLNEQFASLIEFESKYEEASYNLSETEEKLVSLTAELAIKQNLIEQYEKQIEVLKTHGRLESVDAATTSVATRATAQQASEATTTIAELQKEIKSLRDASSIAGYNAIGAEDENGDDVSERASFPTITTDSAGFSAMEHGKLISSLDASLDRVQSLQSLLPQIFGGAIVNDEDSARKIHDVKTVDNVPVPSSALTAHEVARTVSANNFDFNTLAEDDTRQVGVTADEAEEEPKTVEKVQLQSVIAIGETEQQRVVVRMEPTVVVPVDSAGISPPASRTEITLYLDISGFEIRVGRWKEEESMVGVFENCFNCSSILAQVKSNSGRSIDQWADVLKMGTSGAGTAGTVVGSSSSVVDKSKAMSEVFRRRGGALVGNDAVFAMNEHPNSTLRSALVPVKIAEGNSISCNAKQLGYVIDYVVEECLSDHLLNSSIRWVCSYKPCADANSIRLVAESLNRATLAACSSSSSDNNVSVWMTSEVSLILNSIRFCPLICDHLTKLWKQSASAMLGFQNEDIYGGNDGAENELDMHMSGRGGSPWDGSQSPATRATAASEGDWSFFQSLQSPEEAGGVSYCNRGGPEDGYWKAETLEPNLLIVDIGCTSTRVYPVFMGEVCSKSIRTCGIGGETFTEYLTALLTAKPAGMSASFNALAPLRKIQLAREMKEKYAFVGANPQQQQQQQTSQDSPANDPRARTNSGVGEAGSSSNTSATAASLLAVSGKARSWLRSSMSEFTRSSPKNSSSSLSSADISGNVAATSATSSGGGSSSTAPPPAVQQDVSRTFETTLYPENRPFIMPLEKERHYCTEIMFSPRIYQQCAHEASIVSLILDSVMSLEPHQRKEVCSTICLTGRSALLPGLADRLQYELLSSPGGLSRAGVSKCSIFPLEQMLANSAAAAAMATSSNVLALAPTELQQYEAEKALRSASTFSSWRGATSRHRDSIVAHALSLPTSSSLQQKGRKDNSMNVNSRRYYDDHDDGAEKRRIVLQPWQESERVSFDAESKALDMKRFIRK